jgi:tripartite-type tricarboxylate transporter receptor subunit TctC
VTIHSTWSHWALAAALVMGGSAFAQDTIRLVVPYGPGGIVDYVGRILGRQLSESFGRPAVVENRPGAGGMAGTDAVARSAPDGTTLLLTDPAIIIAPMLQADVSYDVREHLQTVSIVSASPQVLVTALSLPVNSVRELIAYGKANSAKLGFASAGIGTTSHLAGEMFKSRTGIDAIHVPYKGIGASYTDLMTGKVHIAFSNIAAALPFTSDKRVRAIATTGRQRTNVFPDLPTVSEAGVPGFEVELWLGVFAPAGVPAPVLARLSGELQKALQAPDVQAALAKVGIEARGSGPEQAAAFVRAEFEKWRQVIRDGKIKGAAPPVRNRW